ncbi:alpha/beta fold hydrolase [Pseudomonas cremoricolorata]|uniref:alpha/beta fold hydrolase n=1 Tax=Pseudomonas cremoricolorata TaxID=157783 RepID=UPI00041221A1|nr:alpha/beta hydrolase [Pseudomonas cremoricolorata]
MHLIPWSHRSSEGFTLRGWRSPASGKPLLHVLHGNGFCCLVYQPLLLQLSEHFDLWLSDVQGHGDSDHGGAFRGWDRTAALAVEAFQAGRGEYAQVPRYALGHSFGGVLSGLIVATHPQLFERAVLLDPVLFSRRMIGLMKAARLLGLERRHGLARKAASRRSQWPDRAAALAGLRGRGIFKGWQDEALQAYVEHALGDSSEGVVLKCRPSREADVFASMPRRLWPSLQRIDVATLILHGEASYPFVGPSAQRLARINPQVQQRQVPGGHCFMQEHVEATTEQVRSFLLAAR